MTNDNKFTHPYKDIIHLPRHKSAYRQPMSIHNRSAQFSPFAAVAGYDLAIKESSRLTDKRIDLDEHAKVLLDEKLRVLKTQLKDLPEIDITFFQADHLKSGGRYLTYTGIVKKIDTYEHALIMTNGTRLFIEDIIDLKGSIFQNLDTFSTE